MLHCDREARWGRGGTGVVFALFCFFVRKHSYFGRRRSFRIKRGDRIVVCPFSKTSFRFLKVAVVVVVLDARGEKSISLSILVRSNKASSASVVTVLVFGSNFICLPLFTALGVKKALMLSLPYS